MPEQNKDIFVFARNNVEMQQAQDQLVDWAEAKIIEEVRERDDLNNNLELAEKAGWETATLKRAIRRAQKRITYYDKVKAALEAGYQIVPNMDVEVFAVRTEAKNPRKNAVSDSSRNWMPVPADQEPSGAEKGEGRYVRPEANFNESQKKLEGDKVLTTRWASEFRDVDFPFALAKVAVLDATNKAMATKIFDDMGVLPRRVRHADPMVIGRLRFKDGREERFMSFVVAWFLETSEL
jgi:hypothetical protein